MAAAALFLAVDPEPGADRDAASTPSTSEALRPAVLESYRPMLTNYARRWLHNTADIEDAVQETLAAALTSNRFAGRSSPATWLHGILKHKIVDTYRRQARTPLLAPAPDGDASDDSDALFTSEGRWRESPVPWPSPEAVLESRQLQAVIEDCLDSLPTTTARAFKMREMMGMHVTDICDVLGVSPNHCYVLLFRARMRLRALLEKHMGVRRAPEAA